MFNWSFTVKQRLFSKGSFIHCGLSCDTIELFATSKRWLCRHDKLRRLAEKPFRWLDPLLPPSSCHSSPKQVDHLPSERYSIRKQVKNCHDAAIYSMPMSVYPRPPVKIIVMSYLSVPQMYCTAYRPSICHQHTDQHELEPIAAFDAWFPAKWFGFSNVLAGFTVDSW